MLTNEKGWLLREKRFCVKYGLLKAYWRRLLERGRVRMRKGECTVAILTFNNCGRAPGREEDGHISGMS